MKKGTVLIKKAYKDGEVCEVVKCLVCGKEIELWLNGGELDFKECCGYSYYGAHKTIQIIAEERYDRV